MASTPQVEDKKVFTNPLAEAISVPIYCLSIKRYPDKRTYFYAYYTDMHVLLCSALRLEWHALAKYPIEYFKGSY